MKKINEYAVVLLLLLVTVLTFGIISEYIKALLLAAIMAGLFGGLYGKLLKKFRSSISALIVTFLLIFTVLIPVIFVATMISSQAIAISKSASPVLNEIAEHPNDYVKHVYHNSFLVEIFNTELEFVSATQKWFRSGGQVIISSLQKMGANVTGWIVRLFIFLFAFYYFLIDGKTYLQWTLKNIPIAESDKRLLLANFLTVAEATLKGTFVIAVIQGSIGGLTMFFLGVPYTMLWWILMIFASIIPAAGPAIIWIPAAIFLYLTGHHTESIILTLVGTFVIGLVDNFLRPKLVGQDVKMPELMILVTTLGGIAVYGLAGVIIGPIIGALFMTTWEIFGRTFSDKFLVDVKDNK